MKSFLPIIKLAQLFAALHVVGKYLSLWVPDVYNDDIIIYMVYLVHVQYMYQIMFACHSLLHKLSIAASL